MAAYFSGSQLVTRDNYEDLLQGYNKLKIAISYDGSDREEYDLDANWVVDNGITENEQGFITNDGMLYVMYNDDGIGGGGFVDINGPNSGPNTHGRDIFVFYLNKAQQRDRLCNNMWGQNSSCVPLDGSRNYGYCYGDDKSGDNCGARLIEEGKMNY